MHVVAVSDIGCSRNIGKQSDGHLCAAAAAHPAADTEAASEKGSGYLTSEDYNREGMVDSFRGQAVSTKKCTFSIKQVIELVRTSYARGLAWQCATIAVLIIRRGEQHEQRCPY